jgi:hypothetical protein
MAIHDRIRTTTTQTGVLTTVDVSATAPSGYKKFSATSRFAVNDANIPVVISHQTLNEWQVCWCTYSATDQLTVNTVLASSKSDDTAVSFSAGTKDVFVANSARAIAGLRENNTFTGANTFANTGLKVLEAGGSPTQTLAIAPGSSLTADRTLTLTTGDANRTLDISAGDVTISNAGRALIDDADAAAQRTTLGLGAIALRPDIVNADVNASADIAATKLAYTPTHTGGQKITLQNKLFDVVSPMDFGAVGDGTTDDRAKIESALNSGRVVDGGGRTYAVAGQIIPSSMVGLRNITLVQTANTATNSYDTLRISGISNFFLENVTVNMGSTVGTQSTSGNSNTAIKIGGSQSGSGSSTTTTYVENFSVSNVRITGNGCGTGLFVVHAREFVVDGVRVHDRISGGATADPTNDSQNGIAFENCRLFSVSNCVTSNLLTRLSSVDTLKWTRGFLFAECSEFSAAGCVADTCDQGFDFSGGVADTSPSTYAGNRNFTLSNSVAQGCGIYGFKFANVTHDGQIVGCVANWTGGHGFTVTTQDPAAYTLTNNAYRTQNLEFVGCRAIQSAEGINGGTTPAGKNWAGLTETGFRIGGVAGHSYPRNIKFIDCVVSNYKTTAMAEGFNNGAVETSAAPNYCLNCSTEGNITTPFSSIHQFGSGASSSYALTTASNFNGSGKNTFAALAAATLAGGLGNLFRGVVVDEAGRLLVRYDDGGVRALARFRNADISAVNHGMSLEFYLGRGNTEVLSGALKFLAEEDYADSLSRSAYLTLETIKDGTVGERLRVDASGNVGIGTTAPQALLHSVKLSAGAATVAAFLQNPSTSVNTEVRLAMSCTTNSLSQDRHSWIGLVNTGGTNGHAMTFVVNAAGNAGSERLRLTNDTDGTGLITIADNNNFVVGTTYGTKIGTSTTQKLAFYNATPIVQRASASQAAVATTAATQTTPWGFSTQAQADGIITLLNEIRTTLVNLGLMKGSA